MSGISGDRGGVGPDRGAGGAGWFKDGSAEIAYEFVEQYPDTFRIIYKANGGHGSAINTGLMMASGEYVKILDSDDWVERDAFCRLVDCLETEGTDIVWSNYYWVYEMDGEKAIQYRDPFPEVVYGKNTGLRILRIKPLSRCIP